MPGVITTTGTRPGPTELGVAPASTYFVAGLTERGSTTEPILVRSLGEYVAKCGARVTYGALYDDLEAFFTEGGQRAYVARVVGPAAAEGTLTLQDRAGVPLNTLRIDAVDEGAWSSQVSVEVRDGNVADTFTLVIRHNGDVVETFSNLASPAAAAAALAASGYVRATDLGSATAAPANNPAVMAATALSAGTDDRAAVTASTVTTALDRFNSDLGAGAVATPGYDAGTVAAAVVAHARARNRLALLAPASGQSPAGVTTTANGLRTTTGAEHAALLYPWVQVANGAGGVRTISPEGFVAGLRARAHVSDGPWRAPAGAIGQARHVVGLERELTRSEADALNDDAVSAIRRVAGTIRLYGWRSLSTDVVNYRLLTSRDVLNYVADLGADALEPFVFDTIDASGHLFNRAEGALRGILEPMRTAGGLYERIAADGTVIDPGYRIDTGPSVNTADSLAAGELRANIAVRVSPSAELIRLTITKVSLTQAF